MAEQVIRWVTPIDPKRLKDKAFKALLRAIAADPCDNGYLPFARLPMVHFASIIIFDKASPPLLVFESNIDASWKEYVTQLVCVGRQALDCIYEGTRGYPPRGSPASSVRRFFHGLKRKTQLYHIGHPNRTVQEIRGDHELRRSIAYVLDHDSDLRQLPPREIMREIHARAKCPRLWFWERRHLIPPQLWIRSRGRRTRGRGRNGSSGRWSCSRSRWRQRSPSLYSSIRGFQLMR
jgi:hypothetical protein